MQVEDIIDSYALIFFPHPYTSVYPIQLPTLSSKSLKSQHSPLHPSRMSHNMLINLLQKDTAQSCNIQYNLPRIKYRQHYKLYIQKLIYQILPYILQVMPIQIPRSQFLRISIFDPDPSLKSPAPRYQTHWKGFAAVYLKFIDCFAHVYCLWRSSVG